MRWSMIATLAFAAGGCGDDDGPRDVSDAVDTTADADDGGSDVEADAGPDDAVPPPGCGDDQTDPGEACDGLDLNGFTCATVAAGFLSGSLGCRADCSGYDVTGCTAGPTRNAASCEQDAVQAAIDAAVDGDTILVPAGRCTWTTPSAGTPAVRVEGKGLVLRGAGVDATTIVDDTGITGPESLLVVEGAAGRPFRITGFTFLRTGTEDTDTFTIAVGGDALNWRVDHCRFVGPAFGSPDSAVNASGRTYGVIDHCDFEGFARVTVFGDYFGDNHGWKEPLSLGTAEAVFVEDSTFDSDYEGTPIFANAIDSNGNARWVFRHNTLTDHYVEAHGQNWGPGGRGTFSYEVYGNRIIDGETTWVPVSVRGGTDDDWDPGDAFELTCGYPCLDQIGRSTDAGETAIQPQALEPLYEWNNDSDGEDTDIAPHPSFLLHAHHLREGRDYDNDTPRPGYVPYVHPHPVAVLGD
jgi:hypothetical protein